MAKKFYKLFIGKNTEFWHTLSKEEQHDLLGKVKSAVEEVGGKSVIMCDPTWSTEEWHFWGVEEFPDIEAVMEHAKLLADLNWDRYADSMTILGTKF